MASRAFFDPLTLLQLAPAMSATATLLFAHDQNFFLSILTRPENRAISNRLLPSYFNTFFGKGLPVVLGFLAVTVGTCVANLRLSNALLHQKDSYSWYAAGAALALAHLVYVPFVAPPIQSIVEDRSKGNSTKDLDRWLRVNAIRGWTTDLGAWIACVIAVTKTFSPQKI